MKVNFINKAYEIRNKVLKMILIKKLGYDNKHGYSILKSSKSFNFFEKIKTGD